MFLPAVSRLKVAVCKNNS